ncbi:helicostatins [Aricia agestis]|uniref:helicostatins n=1 Tax=Aricia agestis TaxID=91739 RepID=UPI001C2083F9|nr:helicostatins [Aricia agestis]
MSRVALRVTMFDATLIMFCIISGAFCAQEQLQGEHEELRPEESHAGPLEKRSPHYDFGLGKRAYSYVSEYKRLPVYNFGLGKRSRPYSFGLGKRSADDDVTDEVAIDVDAALNDDIDTYDDTPGFEVKRARPYSFGLGKRFDNDEQEKRARMYDFGLGKRPYLYNFGLGKRARQYDFGLGKRYSKFNFGLGKRQRDLHRFSFGLGKRSPADDDDLDV